MDDTASVKQIMELFTVIGRRDYKKTVNELITRFDENMNILMRSDIDSYVRFLVKIAF